MSEVCLVHASYSANRRLVAAAIDTSDPRAKRLAMFINIGIGRDEAEAKKVLQDIAAVQTGKETRALAGRNDLHMEIASDGIIVVDEIEDYAKPGAVEGMRFAHGEVITGLQYWLGALREHGQQ